MIWVVTANTNRCRIFNYDMNPHQLTLVKELHHEEAVLKDSDLVSDKPGHYKTSGPTHGSFSPHEEPKTVEREVFAREIAKELDNNRKQNQYKKLIMVIPPYMNGLVHQHLDKHVKECITHNLNKDYSYLKEHEILDTLKHDLGGLGIGSPKI
jgi:protein required for attachment to host cells